MDSSEKILRFSLVQDLQRLNEIVNEITKYCYVEDEITSWFFPTKNYKFVEEFITKRKIFENGSERLFLELIIDRLYVGIKVILIYIQDCRPLTKFIYSPNQVTLGLCLQNLFHKILEMKEMKPTEVLFKETSTDVLINHKASQTDLSALNKCDSCASAITCMKYLMNIFETKKFAQHFKNVKPQIIDITQFGCMLQTTTAITDNFKQLFEKLSRKESENKLLRNEIELKLNENLKIKRKMVHLEEEVKIYKREHEKSTSKVFLLSSENDELNRSQVQHHLRVRSLENTVENLNNTLAKRNIMVDGLRQDKKVLNDNLVMYTTNHTILLKSSILLEKKFNRIHEDFQFLGNGLEEIGDNLDVLNNKLCILSKLNESTKLKVENLTQDSKSFSREMDDSLNSFRDFKNNLMNFIKITKQKSENNSVTGFKIKGDPVEDITLQIKENEEKIRALNLENERLENILNKFRRLRTIT